MPKNIAIRVFKITAKVLMYILGSVLVLVAGIYIYVNTKPGKSFLKGKAESFLTKKLKTKLTIGSIDFSLPHYFELNRVYIEDRKHDTLLYGEQLTVGVAMLKLIYGETDIKKVGLKKIIVNINRAEQDSQFNYQFVVDAFAGNKKPEKVDKDTAAMKLMLRQLNLDRVWFTLRDENGGSFMTAYVHKMDATLDRFQADKLRFGFTNLNANGIRFHMLTTKPAKKEDSVVAPENKLLLTAGKLKINDVIVDTKDKISGFNYYNNIRTLELSRLVANLRSGEFQLDKFLLANSEFRIATNPATSERIKDTIVKEAPKWMVKIKEIDLDSNTFVMDNWIYKRIQGFDAQHIALSPLSFYAYDTYFTIDSASSHIMNLEMKDQSGFSLDTLHAHVVYTKHQITADSLYIKTPNTLIRDKVEFYFDDINALALHPEKALVNIELKNSRIAFNDLFILVPALQRSISPQKFRNQVMNVNTQITGSLHRLNIPVFQVSGSLGSYINARATLLHVTDINKMMFDITLHPSRISKYDLAKFVHFTPAGFAQLPPLINVRATALGSVNNLQTDFHMNGANLLLDAKATLKNINNMKRFQYNAYIRNSRIQKSVLLAFIPGEKLPKSIALPQLMILTGKLSGDVNNILTDIRLGGSYGLLTAKGYVRNFTNAEKSRYDLKITTTAFEIGKLIRQDTILSKVTMQAAVKGGGFNPKTMQASLETYVNSIGFKDYNYSDIHVNANLNKGSIHSTGSVKDPNLNLNYKGTADISARYPTGELWLHLDTARLHALNLMKDTLDLAMIVHVQADNLSPDNVNAFAKLDSVRVNINKQQLYLDSIVAVAKAIDGKQDLKVRSDIMDMNANGAFQYDKLIPSIMQYINNYYKITKVETVVSEPQQITFNGIIREHPLVKKVISGLTKYDTITFAGNYSSKATDSALNFNLKMPFVAYKADKLYNGKISVLSSNEQLKYSIQTDTLFTADTRLYGTQLTGYVAHDSLIADAVTKDINGKNLYLLGATAAIKGDEYIFRLKENLILNYKQWTVAPQNSIFYSPRGFYVNDFKLAYRQSDIDIQSEQQQPGSPINLAVNNFQISDITALINKDTLLATGIINAKARVSDFEKEIPAFEGNVKIDSIYYKKTAVGNLAIDTRKVTDNNISANGALTGNGNDVKLIGNYYLNNLDKQFDADVNIAQLNVASIEGFTNGNITNAKGSVNGNIKLTGKFAEPKWNGIINMKDPSFRLAKFGTIYKMENQKITLNYPEITLNNFTVKDSANNTLTVNGSARATSKNTFGLNLGVKSDNFIVVNTPKATNSVIFGFAAVNTNIRVTGSSVAPDIQGTISLTDNTDATLVLPEKNVDKDASKSIVRFIDKDTFPLPEKVLFVPENPESVSITTFLNYNLNVELSPKAALTVIIDPATGDEIKLKGDAKLNIGVDPGGNILLAGNYNLDQGHYILHYQFLERQFNLLSGSTVAFGGGPLDAQVDIKAEYIANTSAIDLVGNELGDLDNRTATTFNQKIPFRVLLYLKGTFRNLQISFDIQMPDENRGVSNTIVTTVENKLTQLRADPAAINKQVFSLLVLNRFVGEQSMDFFKGSGDGISDIARQSVSKFLSAALDQIASDLIKGVDIDLNLNSYKDYSTGDEQQRTDLNIGVTKRFMDDRLSISVGKNLGIEGQDRTAKARQQNTASYMPDATVNYKLTKDGRYMLRAYSKNKFEVIMDGYIVETGLSFIVSMDYDKFNELFNKKRKNKKG